MMDGWMARHRGKHWGRKRRAKGQERVQWHEIKSAILYRLRDQATVSPRRRALLSKHVVAVPATTDPVTFGRRVQDEARRMGLAQAKQVYVVMDGGVWLWNIFEDRFKLCAVGTLDFYHASQHLHALADELFGDSHDARLWCARILHSLRHRSPRKLFQTLAELMASPPSHEERIRSAIRCADEYFTSHKDHMNYAAAANAGLPIGSGSMESQCSQFQDRLKRRGQFWSHKGFAPLLEVAVRYQNGEILSLWAA
jgi:HPt (histidine-containing phosphotransfer) domain-containing protein